MNNSEKVDEHDFAPGRSRNASPRFFRFLGLEIQKQLCYNSVCEGCERERPFGLGAMRRKDREVQSLDEIFGILNRCDILREANPKADSGAEEMLSLIVRLAIDTHKRDTDTQVALAYDSGIGQ